MWFLIEHEIECYVWGVAYSSSVLDLRLPNAYCDELANCAIEFIVEYPCFDSPLPKTVGDAPVVGCVGCDDVDRLPAFWNLPKRLSASELGGGTAFIE